MSLRKESDFMLQGSPMYAYIPAKAAWFKDSEGNIMAVIQSL